MKNIIILTSLIFCFVLSSCDVVPSPNNANPILFKEGKLTEITSQDKLGIVVDSCSNSGGRSYLVCIVNNNYIAWGDSRDSIQIGDKVHLHVFAVETASFADTYYTYFIRK